MFRQILLVAVLALSTILTSSCGKQVTPTAKVESKSQFWLGKTFITSTAVSPRAEEGGSDFITFVDATTANLKGGDIVETMNYVVVNDEVQLVGTQTGRKVTFILKDQSYLLDAYNVKWVEKK